ncbi:LacI family DNA-binding transcriptional regulator [Brenneria corticis]|uniref:LacI family transcriptional regulator n=1 Tax=Brenneria corticis TaxID=2173106 RepID=A0A2U1UDC0_9GAMM|nr:LacI family DNA-binding transcriptional regulator [Brenneria sp. CFCC 11842]PWC19663.1 LacI family transcriptional regulator [Brenneria sp. CFCC 11842]
MTTTSKSWVTAADVARRAGVSRSAVSRAFTDGASISDHTRQKVMAAAAELGYQVNVIARSMIKGSNNFIGIVTAGFDNPFRSKLLAPIVHQLSLRGFMPLLMDADDPQQLEPSLRQLISYQVAGVIITSGAPPLSLAQDYLAKRIPVTLINRSANSLGADSVSSDNVQGGRLAARELIARGARKLAFIGENQQHYSTAERRVGFGDELAQHGLIALEHFCGQGGYQGGWAGADALFSGDEQPDGLFCATDMLAFGALDYLRRHHPQAVPTRVKVVGFDDIPQASFAAYDLTTIHQDTDMLACRAVDALLMRIRQFDRPVNTFRTAVRLVRRGST